MKQIFLTSKIISRTILASALAVMMFTVSCQKEACGPNTKTSPSADVTAKTKRMQDLSKKALRDFTVSLANGSTTNTNGSGSSTWSSGVSMTTYSTPSSNVYVWSDPSEGVTFTLTESTGGSGIGQLSVNGSDFDYNYVLSIRSDGDPTWNGFLNGPNLRGVVAIQGEIDGTDFSLHSIAFFLVGTNGGSGTYEFMDWETTGIGSGTAIGEVIDLTNVTGNGATLSGLGDAGTIYFTSGGHIDVSDNSFDMTSDSKVKDIANGTEYPISGSIMFE
ncbi:MAG: hypothetical protein K0S44_2530 [Bacteroidetes bacterium]|jgi:hypothetical protein|nr:hypothetical protein [Bacteroidota bacterium]